MENNPYYLATGVGLSMVLAQGLIQIALGLMKKNNGFTERETGIAIEQISEVKKSVDKMEAQLVENTKITNNIDKRVIRLEASLNGKHE